MTPQELVARFKSFSDAAKDISHLVSKLSKLPGPATGQPDEGDTRVELGAEIHQSLKELEEDFELAKQEAEDFTGSGIGGPGSRRRDSDKERERIALVTQIDRLGEDLKLARLQFRKAQLQAKRNEEAARRKEREQLFAGGQEDGPRSGVGRRKGHDKFSPDELVLNASSDVTAALRRTYQEAQANLQRSQFARETLHQSTAALNSLNESYSKLDTLLSSSRSLVSTLVSSQKSDTWYLETAFWILVYTIVWLVFRRFFYGPIRYFLYLPTRWMLNLTLSVLNVFVGLFASSSVGAAQSSAVASLSTSLKIKPSATAGAPRFEEGMEAPSINVGVGGRSGNERSEEGRKADDATLSEQVGQMTEASREQESKDNSRTGGKGTVLRERREDEKPNSKKRMLEEPVRDEL